MRVPIAQTGDIGALNLRNSIFIGSRAQDQRLPLPASVTLITAQKCPCTKTEAMEATT